MDDVTTQPGGGTGTQVVGSSPAAGTGTTPSGSAPGYDSIDAGASVSSSNVDTDGDGLTDQFERMAGLNPLALDSDGDGLTDGFELATSHTNPLAVDSDGNGVADGAQFAAGNGAATTTGDGTTPTDGTSVDPTTGGTTSNPTGGSTSTGTPTTGTSTTGSTPATGTTDTGATGGTGATPTGGGTGGAAGNGTAGSGAAPIDTDGDGLSDQYETTHGTSATMADSDGDGLADGLEVTLGTDATQADTDHDGLSDGAEVRLGSDPLHAAATGGTTTGGTTTGGTNTGVVGPTGSGTAGSVPTNGGATAGTAGGTGQAGPTSGPQTGGTQTGGTQTGGTATEPGAGAGTATPPAGQPGGPNTGVTPQMPAPEPGSTVTTVTTVTSGNQTVTTVTTATATGAEPTAVTVPHADAHADKAPTPKEPAPKEPTAETSDVAHAKEVNQKFLDAAEKQIGDQYVFGVEVDVNNPDPKVFDCAELTKWAAHQAGTDIPGSSFEQYLDLKQKGLLIPVDEAKHIPGALLFHFSSEPTPGGGRPDEAHVAISKGDGTTVEAADESEGVLSKDAGSRFEYAAVLPGTMPAVTGEESATVPDSAGGGAAQHGTDLDHLTVDDVMHGIMMQESGGDYKAENPYETASGAYQYIDGTWNDYGGYHHASDAPPAVQDAKARSDLEAAYKRLGDWERVIASHFAGEDGQAGPKSDWNQVPHPENHNPSIRQYVDGVEKFITEGQGAQHKSMAAETAGADDGGHADGADGHDVGQVHELAGGASGGTFAIDQGAALGTVDTDGDGLTDAFERMIGSDPTQADSNYDGLSDGHLTTAGHGGPADLDTDHDGLSDTLESALGTNPLLADSDHDGFTDPLEASYGGNPLGSSLGTEATAPASVDPADAGQHDAMHPGVDAGWH